MPGRKEGTLVKETFWNKLRAANGYSYKELSVALGHDRSTIGSWFTGRSIPRKQFIKDICDLFGVDAETGEQEFIKAYKEWESASTRPSNQQAKRSSPAANVVEQEISTIKTDILATILGSVYGKLNFTEYEALRDSILVGKNPQEILYGKVSFEDYINLIKLIENIR
jgi:transcriptional regulator with XRE-family HTH domain